MNTSPSTLSPYFLYSEPPAVPEDSDALFVDRDAELTRAVQCIQHLKLRPPRRILGVVGYARVGKSHFLQRLVKQIGGSFDACVELRIAQGIPDAKTVLREILSNVYVKLHNLVLEKPLVDPEEPSPLEPIEEIMRVYSEAIEGRKMQLSSQVSFSENLSRRLGGSGKLTVKLPSLMRLLQLFDGSAELGGQLEQGSQRTETRQFGSNVEVSPFSEAQLCEVIGLAHEQIRAAHALRYPEQMPFSTLLVIDDFDLLSRRDDGTLDPRPLLASLHDLARFKGLFVLTTVRHDTYVNYEKNFFEIASISPFEKNYLSQIYERQVAHFNAGISPFTRDFIEEAAIGCDGRVGIFLQILRLAHLRWPADEQSQLSFDSFMRRRWENFKQQLPWAVSIIEQAVLTGGGLLDVDSSRKLMGTAAMEVLFADYSAESTLTVEPALQSYLRMLFAKAAVG